MGATATHASDIIAAACILLVVAKEGQTFAVRGHANVPSHVPSSPARIERACQAGSSCAEGNTARTLLAKSASRVTDSATLLPNAGPAVTLWMALTAMAAAEARWRKVVFIVCAWQAEAKGEEEREGRWTGEGSRMPPGDADLYTLSPGEAASLRSRRFSYGG